MNFDKIITSEPINATAGYVTGPGTHFEFTQEIKHRHWENCPTVRMRRASEHKILPDFTGKRLGRFTVIGILAAPSRRSATGKPSGKALAWVVRCSCGRYETRNTNSVRKGTVPDDCCYRCINLKQLQAKDRKRQPRPKNA